MRTSDYIKRAILKYENEGGKERASSEASGVTSAKVQVRDANGNLLAEYDKADFPEQTTNTPNEGLLLVGALAGFAIIAIVAGVLSQGTTVSGGYSGNSNNPPSTPSTTENGEGVEGGGSGNSLMGTSRETCVDTDTSETICFKVENIRCEAIKGTGSLPNYYATYCYANGVKTDLTGKKTQYNGKGLCKETGREGTPGYEFTGKFIACVAAFKSGVLN